MISCNYEAKNEPVQNTFNFIPSKILEIKSDSSFYYNSTNIQVEDSLLIMSNNIDNSLYFYNIEKKNFIKKIEFDILGHNGIGRNIFNYKYVNKDTLFFIGFYEKKITLTDDNGFVKKRYDMVRRTKIDLGNPVVTTSIPMYYRNEKLVFSSFSPYPIIERIETYKNRPVYQTFDLNTDKLKNSDFNFNITKIENHYHPDSYMPVSCKFYNGYLYMFKFDNTVYYIEGDTLKNSININSELFSFIKYNKKPNWNKASSIFIDGLSIYSIRSYNNYIYVIVQLPVNKDKFPKNKRYSFNDKDIAIIVLNDKFEKLTETILPIEKYQRNMFINKEGLWVSNNNPNNPDFDESKLSFTLFKLEKKK